MKKTINRILCSLLAVCLICTAAPAVLAANGTDDHWAAKDLRAFEAAGYLSGDYDPDAAMAERQFAAIVSSIKGVAPANAGVGAFADSDESISRQDAFAAIARIIGLEIPAAGSAALNTFADAGSVSANARAGVAAMVEAGFVQGNGSRFLNPTGTLTVAEGVTVLARVLEDLQSTVVVADAVYTFSTKSGELADAVQIGNTGAYYTLKSGKAVAGTLYGTADLKYADFYAGDVSSTAGFDAVTSATNSKHSIMEGIYSDFRDEVTNADGYHILGVENVSVAVDAKTYVEAAVLAAAGKLSGTVYEKAASIVLNADAAAKPSQYKTLQDNGAYSATVFCVADTVTDAKAELVTGSNWGDYQINVTDPEGTTYLRNARSDEGFTVNSKIQGIILETESGLKVGMEYLQSIWVQPYEVSFNVESVNTHNTHIAKWDNLEELSKLMGETVTRITYIMPDSVYVYEFPGIYIKPVYMNAVAGSFNESYDTFTFSTVPTELTDAQVTVNYTVGSGRNRENYALYSGELAQVLKLDRSVIPADNEGTYSVTISSSNYADIAADYPMTAAQKAQLESLIAQAQAHLDDAGVKEHHDEAAALLAAQDATSAQAADLISELTSHLSVYTEQAGNAGRQSQ